MQHTYFQQNICEGKKDIDARITASELRVLALTTIVPKIIAFSPDFPWRYQDFVVRDASWVDLSGHPEPHRPYFYSECLQPSRKNTKTPVFKTKQFSLYVVVPALQWKEYEDHAEKLEEAIGISNKPTVNAVSTRALSQGAFTNRAVLRKLPALTSTQAQSEDSFTSSVAERPLSHDVIARSMVSLPSPMPL